MDSLGYAIEEIVGLSELKDDLEEKSDWKRIARITILASIFLIFVAFVGYEVHQMIDSYSNPVWSSFESDAQFVPYPGIIICPSSPRFTNQTVTHGGCTTFTGSGQENDTECEPQTIEMLISSYGKQRTQYCLNYNFNDTAIAFNSESYFVITSIISGGELNILPQHSHLQDLLTVQVITPQIHNNSHNNSITAFPLYVQLYDSTKPPPSQLVPSFLVSVDSTNFITLSRTEYHYTFTHNKPNTSEYAASVSAMPNAQKGFQLMLWFSFGSTKVNVWEQTVTLDWITGLGIIAGALGFLRSIYFLIFLIADKIHERCTAPPTNKKKKGRKVEKYELLSE